MKNTNNTLTAIQLNQAIEQLEDLLFCDLVMTYNDYASHNGYDMIYDNDENTINEMYTNAYDAVRVTNHKGYNDNDDYFTYDGYGLMSSFSYQLIQDDNCPIDISELAQWLISEDKLAEYDITVITLDDILASIEDNINDDEILTFKLADYISEDYDEDDAVSDIAQWCIVTLYDYDYDQLSDIINYLGINYQ